MDVRKRKRYGIGFFIVGSLFLVTAVTSFATGQFLMSASLAFSAICFVTSGVLILRQK